MRDWTDRFTLPTPPCADYLPALYSACSRLSLYEANYMVAAALAWNDI